MLPVWALSHQAVVIKQVDFGIVVYTYTYVVRGRVYIIVSSVGWQETGTAPVMFLTDVQCCVKHSGKEEDCIQLKVEEWLQVLSLTEIQTVDCQCCQNV